MGSLSRLAAALGILMAPLVLGGAARAEGPSAAGGYELLMPQGSGPYPAVVVMHGCDGVSAHTRAWALRLVGWGYAALIVDSFRPRGMSNVCSQPLSVAPSARAGDAITAKTYLQGLPNIAKGRIGLIGFSHGGWAALTAAGSFTAVVAYYPWCSGSVPGNTLVLIGSADDWTPAQRCSGGNVKVYAGATHAFDARIDATYLGHRMVYDSDAASDAEQRTHQFFAARLGR